MKKLLLLIAIITAFGMSFSLGYMHGSYVKNSDLEMSYQDGYINAQRAIGPDEMRRP